MCNFLCDRRIDIYIFTTLRNQWILTGEVILILLRFVSIIKRKGDENEKNRKKGMLMAYCHGDGAECGIYSGTGNSKGGGTVQAL